MVTIPQAISVLYPAAIPLNDYVVSDGVIVFWNSALGTQPTAAQLAAVTQAQVDAAVVTAYRNVAKAVYDADHTDRGKLIRAAASVALDAINADRACMDAMAAAVAAATSLADLKTRFAAISRPGQVSLLTLKNAVDNRIDDGTVD